MCYDEKLIDGYWYYRTPPNETWRKMSDSQLNEKIKELQLEGRLLREEIKHTV